VKKQAPFIFLAVGVSLLFVPNLRGVLDFPIFYLIFLYFIFFWIAQASSWNMFSGYSGYFSFGQGAFYGMGVYTTATLINRTGIPFIATLPLAGLFAALLAVFTGYIVFRLRSLRGELFALLTLALDFVLAAVVRRTNFIDGGFGITLGGVAYPEFLGTVPEMIFRLGMIVALLTVFVSYAIYHSRFGQGLFAIRDDENVAEGLGVPTFRYKILIFAIASFFAGLSGGLHALQISYVTVEGIFNIRIPLFVILMAILGGRRHWLGPIFGAVIIYTLNDSFTSAQLEYFNDIAVGSLLIIMILFVREGIFERLRNRLIPGLVVLIGSFVIQLILPLEDTRLITQLAISMLVTISFLLLPLKFYNQVFRRSSQTIAAEGAET